MACMLSLCLSTPDEAQELSVLVEGWSAFLHSYAIVGKSLTVAIVKQRGVKVRFREVSQGPFTHMSPVLNVTALPSAEALLFGSVPTVCFPDECTRGPAARDVFHARPVDKNGSILDASAVVVPSDSAWRSAVPSCHSQPRRARSCCPDVIVRASFPIDVSAPLECPHALVLVHATSEQRVAPVHIWQAGVEH